MILAFNGSPRLKGNTEAMLQAALDGAASTGAETRLIQLYPLNFKGCMSCFSCKLKGGRHAHCAMKDDLSPILEQMAEAGMVVEEEAPVQEQFETFGGETFTGIDLPVDEDDTL